MGGTIAQEVDVPSAEITPWHVAFGLRLRKARRRARYSTREVARLIEDRFRLQLSHCSVARIERGEQRVSIGMLGVLCDIYQVAPIEIALGVDQDEDPARHAALKAGLGEGVVVALVWLEQLLANGSPAPGAPPRAVETGPAS